MTAAPALPIAFDPTDPVMNEAAIPLQEFMELRKTAPVFWVEQAPEARYLKIDASRARARLGWAPRLDLERELAATVEWYAAYGAGEDVRAVSLAELGAFQRG